MLGRKLKAPIEPDEEEEENGLHKNHSLLEYQNKSLCTLISDLRSKLQSKEESYNVLESKFNSIISFINIIDSTINTLNGDISSALIKNKISIDESMDIDNKNTIYNASSDFIRQLLNKENVEKNENQDDINNPIQQSQNQKQTSLSNSATNSKIIVDDDDEKEESNNMKDKKGEKKEVEYTPMLRLSKNIDNLINKLMPIIKLNENQYEKLFENVDEEIANKNKEQEDIINDLNKSLNNCKSELESLKTQNELYKSKITDLEDKLANLTTENFRLKRKINTHPLMPLLVVEGQCLNKSNEPHKCSCMICGKKFDEENENGSNNEEKNENNNANSVPNPNNENTQVDTKNQEEKNDNSINKTNTENNAKENEAMNELIKENEVLRKKIRELHENDEDNSSTKEITEENILGSKIFQSLISQAENILSKLEKMKEVNNNLQKENNILNQKKENEIIQISNSFNDQIDKCSQKLLESSKTIERNKTTIQLLMNKIESLESLLKEKESFNINIIYDSFKKERDNLIKKIDVIKSQKTDYLNKYDDECLKIKQMK